MLRQRLYMSNSVMAAWSPDRSLVYLAESSGSRQHMDMWADQLCSATPRSAWKNPSSTLSKVPIFLLFCQVLCFKQTKSIWSPEQHPRAECLIFISLEPLLFLTKWAASPSLLYFDYVVTYRNWFMEIHIASVKYLVNGSHSVKGFSRWADLVN